jgi:hypothetical protein
MNKVKQYILESMSVMNLGGGLYQPQVIEGDVIDIIYKSTKDFWISLTDNKVYITAQGYPKKAQAVAISLSKRFPEIRVHYDSFTYKNGVIE